MQTINHSFSRSLIVANHEENTISISTKDLYKNDQTQKYISFKNCNTLELHEADQNSVRDENLIAMKYA